MCWKSATETSECWAKLKLMVTPDTGNWPLTNENQRNYEIKSNQQVTQAVTETS